MNPTIIGSRTLALPLRDANFHGGLSTIVVGPRDRRNPIRWFVRLPEKGEAERLPAPLAHDRSTIKFDPVMIYLDQPLPPNVTAVFHAAAIGSDRASVSRRTMYSWAPQPETGRWPGIPFEGRTMLPGETVEFTGHGYWGARKNRGILTELPSGKESHVISVYLLFRISWIPSSTPRARYEYGPTPVVPDPIPEIPGLEPNEG